MKVIKVKLNRAAVRREILMDTGVEDYLAEIAGEIQSDALSLIGSSSFQSSDNYDSDEPPAKIVVERQEDRRNRVAVDIIADRTNEVVQNHVLEKAVEGR